MQIDETEIDGNDPHCPLVLLLDTSYSMGLPRNHEGGKQLPPAIHDLNRSLETLSTSLKSDAVARRRVDVQIVTFGGEVQPIDSWHLAQEWKPPTLEASGDTPMGEAIRTGLSLAADRRRALAAEGISSYRSWVFMLTDGLPTDDVSGVAKLVATANGSPNQADHVLFWSIATGDADRELLRSFEPSHEVLELGNADWPALFIWISKALATVSRSKPGDQISLPQWQITV